MGRIAATSSMTLVDRWSRRLQYGRPIVIVSGLPRSGTSMAMKMLGAGGLPLLTDGARAPDTSNPAGYFEFEPVKQLDKNRDLGWLRDARGKGVKVISWLLTWLPEVYDYRVVFMQRDLDEVIASQDAMLVRRGESEQIAAGDSVRTIYARHLEQVHGFLDRRRCFTTLVVNYRDVIEQPATEAGRLAGFLERPLDIERMAAAVDPRLYRNRSA
jgi:sulfotransferase family protein